MKDLRFDKRCRDCQDHCNHTFCDNCDKFLHTFEYGKWIDGFDHPICKKCWKDRFTQLAYTI